MLKYPGHAKLGGLGKGLEKETYFDLSSEPRYES